MMPTTRAARKTYSRETMIFQQIYVFNAVLLYFLLDGSNQVFCRKNRHGRRHRNRYAEDGYFVNSEDRDIIVDIKYRTDHEVNAPSRSRNVKQYQHPILIEDEYFNPIFLKDVSTPKQLEDVQVFNTSRKISDQDKNPEDQVSKQDSNYNKKKIKSKSSPESSEAKSSEETKRVKELTGSNEKTPIKYNRKKSRHKGTHLKQMLDIENLLGNENILHDNEPKDHKHHLRPSQEAQDGIETATNAEGNNDGNNDGNLDLNNPNNTDQHETTSSWIGHGSSAGDANDLNNGMGDGSHGSAETSDHAGSETTPSSQDLGDSQSSSNNNSTAELPKLPTLNVYSDNSSESCNTHSGYGEDYIYILLNNSGQAERHDLTCHPKIKLGNEMKTAPDKIKIKLYTRKHREEPEILKNIQNENFKVRFSSTIQSFNFCKNKDLKVITHGHTNKAETLDFIEDIKDTYLDESDVNVIIVDWKEISDSPYMLMARLYESVSMVLGHLLDALIKTFKYKKCIHLIGHGVGAHVMGYVSKFTKHEIYRITGLDPERPYFERPPSRTHALEKGDATFVDIIHTSKGIRGYSKSHGDVDFYPNEGITPQPNCTGDTHTILEEDCSHFQALFYFKESISDKDGFSALRCMVGACNPGEAVMGEHVNPSDKGDFYLKTNSKSPYAKAKKPCYKS